MADELFNVIFRGDVLPGQNLAEVKARFAQLFKMDVAKAEGFFSGKPVVLKPNCDRATADKFKAVLEQAGAMVEIRAVAPAQPVAAPPTSKPASVPAAPAPTASTPTVSTPAASAVAATPAPVSAATAATTATADPWSLSAVGSNLLKPGETPAVTPANIDTSHISLVKRNPFSTEDEEPLEPPRRVEAPKLDLSGLQLAAVGETLVEGEAFVPLELDLSALVLDEVGADVLRPEERREFIPANVDTSSMNLAAPGGDLGQIKPPPAPPAPSTDHLSIQK